MTPDILQVGCPPNLFEDTKLLQIGRFLKEGLNNRLQAYLQEVDIPDTLDPLTIDQLKAVNTLQIGDLPITSNLEFPILKLYRTSTSWKRVHIKRETYIGIIYGLNYPILKILPGFLNWIDIYMNVIINEWQQKEKVENPFRGEDFVQEANVNYSLLSNALNDERIFALRTTMRILES